jgi:hypothetical protein
MDNLGSHLTPTLGLGTQEFESVDRVRPVTPDKRGVVCGSYFRHQLATVSFLSGAHSSPDIRSAMPVSADPLGRQERYSIRRFIAQ